MERGKQRRCDGESSAQEETLSGSEGEGGHQPRATGSLRQLGEARNGSSPRAPEARTQPGGRHAVSSARPVSDFREIICSCYFKPLCCGNLLQRHDKTAIPRNDFHL